VSRELDAKVAEKVMGLIFPRSLWVTDTLVERQECPRYTTDPSADYEVLKQIREKSASSIQWMEFLRELNLIQFKRGVGGGKLTDGETRAASDPNSAMYGFYERFNALRYEPGDYSKAALKALGEEI